MDLVVIGLGYVGLPLAIQAARSGFRVTGYDTSTEVVDGPFETERVTVDPFAAVTPPFGV